MKEKIDSMFKKNKIPLIIGLLIFTYIVNFTAVKDYIYIVVLSIIIQFTYLRSLTINDNNWYYDYENWYFNTNRFGFNFKKKEEHNTIEKIIYIIFPLLLLVFLIIDFIHYISNKFKYGKYMNIYFEDKATQVKIGQSLSLIILLILIINQNYLLLTLQIISLLYFHLFGNLINKYFNKYKANKKTFDELFQIGSWQKRLIYNSLPIIPVYFNIVFFIECYWIGFCAIQEKAFNAKKEYGEKLYEK